MPKRTTIGEDGERYGDCSYCGPNVKVKMVRSHGKERSGGCMACRKLRQCYYAMHRRCSIDDGIKNKQYLLNGITVCSRWCGENGFYNFREDMGVCPDGHTIDRIDNSQGYCKENCRWATPKDQAKNRRTTKFLTVDGTTKSFAEWELECGLVKGSLRGRLNAGWDPKDAVTIPPLKYTERNAKIPREEIDSIRSSTKSDESLASIYGVSVSSIRSIRNKRTWNGTGEHHLNENPKWRRN